MYICPVCQSPLVDYITADKAQVKSLRCQQNHSFDRHKKGYINLLLAQNKRTKQPGDDAAMVSGRRAFLSAGYYQLFADQLANMVVAAGANNVLDVGCGEGFYLYNLLKRHAEMTAFGVDISKPAIQAAASLYKGIEWAVASSARLPYEDQSFDLLLSVFSRVNSEEFLRVLKPGGYVLFAGPEQKHLLGLRRLIYPIVKEYMSDKHEAYFSTAFTLISTVTLRFPLVIKDPMHMMNLLNMTPHGQRINEEGLDKLLAIQQLTDEVDFRIYLYRKGNSL